jgi:hypothetical protein
MVRPERLELPTFWFVARRSIQLSYGRAMPKSYHNLFPALNATLSAATDICGHPTRKAIRAYSEALSRSVGALVDPRSSGTATPASPEREPKGCALPGTATNAEDKTPDEAKTKEDAETRQDAEPTRK